MNSVTLTFSVSLSRRWIVLPLRWTDDAVPSAHPNSTSKMTGEEEDFDRVCALEVVFADLVEAGEVPAVVEDDGEPIFLIGEGDFAGGFFGDLELAFGLVGPVERLVESAFDHGAEVVYGEVEAEFEVLEEGFSDGGFSGSGWAGDEEEGGVLACGHS